MIKRIFVLLFASLIVVGNYSLVDAQAKKKRSSTKRTTTKKTTNSKTKTNIKASAKVDSVAKDSVVKNDTLIRPVKKSLRQDDAVERNLIKERTPLAYQRIREDDAVYREKIWREIDTREKMNLPFRYSAQQDNGDQRFIAILLQAVQSGPDSGGVTAFSNIDDRFTTPMTMSEVTKIVAGAPIVVPVLDSLGNPIGSKEVVNEINLDSFYKFHIKEEVIFDKQSSRLFWRILGIAPVKRIQLSNGDYLPEETELFWIYYPDLRPILAKYEVYNPKNYGARMTWEELFESRFFSGRIIKSTLDNPYNRSFREYPALKEKPLFQLYEGEKVKDKIFNYEQNLWSY
jgi:gliding motility associated protien GldN